MQQLSEKLKNLPRDASQVPCSRSLRLNRDQSLSVADSLKNSELSDNNPEVNQSRKGEHSLLVFVLNREGKPLMPCSPSKANKLLKGGKAKVVKRVPFTIQMNYGSSGYKQEVSLGIDTGFGNIGYSCVTDKDELACGTLVLDGKTSSRLTERRMYRRGRRNKLWYREPRFSNRAKPEGWLPPSTERRYDTHLSLIARLKAILPISSITIEVAKFDIAKIENGEIEGVGYQQGDMYEYQNMRSYLLAREHGLCQLCHKKFDSEHPSHIHHCKQRNQQGSNRAKNLAILHEKCHTKLHRQGLKLSAPKEYKAPTFVSIINKRFWNDVPDAKMTYGNITFVNRQQLGLEKTHYNDAFVIAGGTTQERCLPITIRQKHRNNRAIQMNRKGFAPSIRRRRYPIQPKDLVWIDGEKLVVTSTHCNGTRVITEASKKSYSIKTVKKAYHFGSFAYN